MHVLLENTYLTQENKVSTTLQHLILRLYRTRSTNILTHGLYTHSTKQQWPIYCHFDLSNNFCMQSVVNLHALLQNTLHKETQHLLHYNWCYLNTSIAGNTLHKETQHLVHYNWSYLLQYPPQGNATSTTLQLVISEISTS